MSALDLNILPLLRLNGRDQSDLPGLYAFTPPHRSARGRAEDRLILYLSVIGEAPLLEEQYNSLMVRLAQRYYKTPGSVTAALRATAETLNEFLLERNLQSANSGRQGIGLFTQAVLRGETVYLALCGPSHAFLIRPQAPQHYYDPQGAGRGLGLSRMTSIRFFQIGLQPNEFLLLAHQPAEAWLAESGPATPAQGIEGMRRRLLQSAGENFNAVLVQAQVGTGRMRLLRLKPAFSDMARPAVGVQLASATAVPTQGAEVTPTELKDEHVESELSRQMPDAAGSPMPAGQQKIEVKPADESQKTQASPAGTRRVSPVPSIQDQAVKPSVVTESAKAVAGAESLAVPPPKPSAVRQKPTRLRPGPGIKRFFGLAFKALRAFFSALGRALGLLFSGLRGLIRRVLPDETLLNISPATMVFLALAIPLVISVIGGMVYIERGQARQYQDFYQKALQKYEEAGSLTDPVEMRKAWQVALGYLDQAELYRVTEQSQGLRSQVQSHLDQLDAIERLDFQPVLSEELGRSVRITRIAATASELYLLNASQGNILRAMLRPDGYDLDESFACGPAFAPGMIGPLIDLVALPSGDPKGATVLGMDLAGRLMYCIPGENPTIVTLAPPPVNFGNPKAFALDAGDLYIIDPPKRSVWVYRNMKVDQPPNQFLGEITSFMVDVVDLAVNLDDIYLLHSNGKVTKCTFGAFEGVPTRCEDPLPYTDPRPGRQGGEVIPDALFDQIVFSPPPDPSLYMLDPQNQAVYHFSLRLTLDRQYRASRTLADGPATAFAVSSTRLVFLAFGDKVFYSALP